MSRSKSAGDKPRSNRNFEPGQGAPASTGRAVVIVPVLTRHSRTEEDPARPRLARSPQARHDEAVGLATAIDLEPVHTQIVTIAADAVDRFLREGTVRDVFPVVSSVVFDAGGNETRIDYSRSRVNKGIDNGRFSFKIPEGVQVIKQ